MKKAILFLALSLTGSMAFAQETAAPAATPLEISGSADGYYKYDFSKKPNIGTSFATDQNSFSLGMLDVVLKKTTGKFSFVGEVAFGPRGQDQSIPLDGVSFTTSTKADSGKSFHIQNLYGTYTFTDKLSVTAGYAGTFIGYEVISPLGNYHYSTSYLFTNGPFQHSGVKVNYKITDKFAAMAGLFNDQWNVYQSELSTSAVGGQLSYAADGVSVYLNFMDGSKSGTIYDLTASFQLTKEFKLGVNAADFSNTGDKGHTGFALYPSYALSDSFGLGLRGEYFKSKKGSLDTDVAAITLSGNYKVAGLTIIPEFRMDNNSNKGLKFVDVDGNATKSASQVLLAMIYGF